MRLLLCLFLIIFCSTTFAVKEPIGTLYTVDKARKIKSPGKIGPSPLDAAECDPDYEYRTYDASCNNLENPTWGQSHTGAIRIFPSTYSDDISLPPVASDGSELPNARVLVTTLFSDEDAPDTVTLAVGAWAQFIAHDTLRSPDKTGVDDCCSSTDVTSCLPITVPEDDSFYSQFNVTCLSVTRTETTENEGTVSQINAVTHILDASQVYGSDEDTAHSLRSHEGGQLISRVDDDGREFLPSEGDCYNSDVCYTAGDIRVNQNTHLSVLQTLLLRAHNRVAQALAEVQPDWEDEKLYQEARSIVIAAYQHVTYNEFVPLLISDETATKAKLKSEVSTFAYDREIPPVILTVFGNPVYRIFHSAIQGLLGLYNYRLDLTNAINITDYMNSPEIIEEGGNFDQLILGLITEPMQQLDEFYPEQIQGELFHSGRPYGTDLNALDIQRARDHGSPTYITTLYGCTGVEITSWDDLADWWPQEKIDQVSDIYASVDDVDLFVGLNFENKEEGHRLSPTAECIIAEQLYRLKNGDRFWHENPDGPQAFTPEQLTEIRKVTFSRLICLASDFIINVPVNAWLPASLDNPVVSCDVIPSVDFTAWAGEEQ